MFIARHSKKKAAAASAVAYSQLRLRGDGADEEHENISFLLKLHHLQCVVELLLNTMTVDDDGAKLLLRLEQSTAVACACHCAAHESMTNSAWKIFRKLFCLFLIN